VAIGELSDITLENIKNQGITYIINLTGITEERKQNYLNVFPVDHGCGLAWLPIITDPDEDLFQFQRECKRALRELFRQVVADHKVLIHCIDGMDRAPFIAALLLAMTRNLDIKRINVMGAYIIIKKLRPQIIEHLEWLKNW